MTALQTDIDIAARLRSMRFGYTAGMYPVPGDVSADDQPLWHLRRAAELGCTMLQLTELPKQAEVRNAVRVEAALRDLTLEGNVRAIFVPLGTEPGSNAAALRQELEWAVETGMKVVRAGYGRLTLETTRFAPERNLDEQLAHVTACLRAAAPIAEEVGLPIAIENHCDFTGREVAQVLRDVDSPWVGPTTSNSPSRTPVWTPEDALAGGREHLVERCRAGRRRHVLDTPRAGPAAVQHVVAGLVDPDRLGGVDAVAVTPRRTSAWTCWVVTSAEGDHGLHHVAGGDLVEGAGDVGQRVAVGEERGGIHRAGLQTEDGCGGHRPDPTVPYAESIGAIRDLLDEGVIRLAGISNADVAQIDEANEILGGRLVSVQNQFSPRFRSSLGELEHCAALGIAFLPWSPLGGIGRAGDLGADHSAFQRVADAHGVSPHQVALAWELALAPVVIPIPGASRPASIQDSVLAADLQLTAAEVEELSA